MMMKLSLGLRLRKDPSLTKTSKLFNAITEKTVQIEMMMSRITEVNLLEFELDCNLKLLEATQAKFAEERAVASTNSGPIKQH